MRAQADERPPIHIGILTDLTGRAAYLGQQTRIGAEMAADEINTPIKRLLVTFGDHGLDATRAISEAQKMLNADHVHAIFSNFSGPSRAAAPVVQNARRLFVYSAAAVSPLKENRNAFKSYLDYRKGCESIARHWKSEGLSFIGLLQAESEFGVLCEEGAKKVFPNLVATAYKTGESVSSQALILKSKAVAGVLNASYEGDMDNMLKAFVNLGFVPRIGANEDAFTERIMAAHANALGGATSFGMPTPDREFCAQVSARDLKHETCGCDHAGMAYLHLKQMYAALQACAGEGIECQARAMLKSPPDPRFGFRRFENDHQAVFDDSLRSFENRSFRPAR